MEAIELGKQVVTKLVSGELPDEVLISLFISKVLGILIVAGACIVKLPQIVNVWKSKSGVATPAYMGLISKPMIAKLYDMNATIFLASKLPMIVSAFQKGKTGQQSFFTNALQFMGGLARVFTSIKEKAGMPMVRGFILGSCVNGTVTAQILYYGKDGRKPTTQKQEPAEEVKKNR